MQPSTSPSPVAALQHRDRFAETMVYAREDAAFHTRLCVYNYFLEIFPKEQSGATVFLTFYDGDGRIVAEHQESIPYRGQLQFDLSRLGVSFDGRAGVAIVPEVMPPVQHTLSMATAYYVFYFGTDETAGRSVWNLRLRSQQGTDLAESDMPDIPVRAMARVAVSSVFPDAVSLVAEDGVLAIEVEGTNLMGPLTYVRAPNGDFNIHHF